MRFDHRASVAARSVARAPWRVGRSAALRVGASAAMLVASSAGAQTMRPWSVQGSALYVGLGGSAYAGLMGGVGGEAQLRYSALPASLSIGGGFQYSSHPLDASFGIDARFRLAGAFVEPRYVFGFLSSDRLAPYGSLRLALLRQSGTVEGVRNDATGVQMNAGGGVLVSLTSRVNLDLGLTLGYIRFGTLRITEGADSETVPGGTGRNLVMRLGLAVGVY